MRVTSAEQLIEFTMDSVRFELDFEGELSVRSGVSSVLGSVRDLLGRRSGGRREAILQRKRALQAKMLGLLQAGMPGGTLPVVPMPGLRDSSIQIARSLLNYLLASQPGPEVDPRNIAVSGIIKPLVERHWGAREWGAPFLTRCMGNLLALKPLPPERDMTGMRNLVRAELAALCALLREPENMLVSGRLNFSLDAVRSLVKTCVEICCAESPGLDRGALLREVTGLLQKTPAGRLPHGVPGLIRDAVKSGKSTIQGQTILAAYNARDFTDPVFTGALQKIVGQLCTEPLEIFREATLEGVRSALGTRPRCGTPEELLVMAEGLAADILLVLRNPPRAATPGGTVDTAHPAVQGVVRYFAGRMALPRTGVTPEEMRGYVFEHLEGVTAESLENCLFTTVGDLCQSHLRLVEVGVERGLVEAEDEVIVGVAIHEIIWRLIDQRTPGEQPRGGSAGEESSLVRFLGAASIYIQEMFTASTVNLVEVENRASRLLDECAGMERDPGRVTNPEGELDLAHPGCRASMLLAAGRECSGRPDLDANTMVLCMPPFLRGVQASTLQVPLVRHLLPVARVLRENMEECLHSGRPLIFGNIMFLYLRKTLTAMASRREPSFPGELVRRLVDYLLEGVQVRPDMQISSLIAVLKTALEGAVLAAGSPRAAACPDNMLDTGHPMVRAVKSFALDTLGRRHPEVDTDLMEVCLDRLLRGLPVSEIPGTTVQLIDDRLALLRTALRDLPRWAPGGEPDPGRIMITAVTNQVVEEVRARNPETSPEMLGDLWTEVVTELYGTGQGDVPVPVLRGVCRHLCSAGLRGQTDFSRIALPDGTVSTQNIAVKTAIAVTAEMVCRRYPDLRFALVKHCLTKMLEDTPVGALEGSLSDSCAVLGGALAAHLTGQDYQADRSAVFSGEGAFGVAMGGLIEQLLAARHHERDQHGVFPPFYYDYFSRYFTGLNGESVYIPEEERGRPLAGLLQTPRLALGNLRRMSGDPEMIFVLSLLSSRAGIGPVRDQVLVRSQTGGTPLESFCRMLNADQAYIGKEEHTSWSMAPESFILSISVSNEIGINVPNPLTAGETLIPTAMLHAAVLIDLDQEEVPGALPAVEPGDIRMESLVP